jgi:hypothetical protein
MIYRRLCLRCCREAVGQSPHCNPCAFDVRKARVKLQHLKKRKELQVKEPERPAP